MTYHKWFDRRLQRVTVEQIRRYLLTHGWRLQTYPRPELLVFEGLLDDFGQPIIQVLPSSETARDYPMRRQELLCALSTLEDRYLSDILDDVLAAPNGDAPAAQDDAKTADSPAQVS